MTRNDTDFPDKVALLEDGWAVRFRGCIEGARWASAGAAHAHLFALQSGTRQPQPEIHPPSHFTQSLLNDQ